MTVGIVWIVNIGMTVVILVTFPSVVLGSYSSHSSDVNKTQIGPQILVVPRVYPFTSGCSLVLIESVH